MQLIKYFFIFAVYLCWPFFVGYADIKQNIKVVCFDFDQTLTDKHSGTQTDVSQLFTGGQSRLLKVVNLLINLVNIFSSFHKKVLVSILE